jgi:hypothetical protein
MSVNTSSFAQKPVVNLAIPADWWVPVSAPYPYYDDSVSVGLV